MGMLCGGAVLGDFYEDYEIFKGTSVTLVIFISLSMLMFLQIWDFSTHLNALAESETDVSQGGSSVFNQAPLMKFGGHKEEGYAIDWSPLVPGRLVSGTSNRSCSEIYFLI